MACTPLAHIIVPVTIVVPMMGPMGPHGAKRAHGTTIMAGTIIWNNSMGQWSTLFQVTNDKNKAMHLGCFVLGRLETGGGLSRSVIVYTKYKYIYIYIHRDTGRSKSRETDTQIHILPVQIYMISVLNFCTLTFDE